MRSHAWSAREGISMRSHAWSAREGTGMRSHVYWHNYNIWQNVIAIVVPHAVLPMLHVRELQVLVARKITSYILCIRWKILGGADNSLFAAVS